MSSFSLPLQEKFQNTTYTIYQIDVEDAEFTKLHKNPAYVTEMDDAKKEEDWVSGFSYDGENRLHLNGLGVFTLADIRIGVEDAGNYNDQHDGTLTSSGYDEALWVDIPANAIPLRTATISNDTNTITYETNIGGKTITTGDIDWNAAVAQQDKPLRVFYTVGIQDVMLTESGEIDLSKVSARHLNKYRVTAETAEKRGLPAGYVEFLSNWYDDTSTYDYNGSETPMTFGDPVVSFPPSEANRYYVFQDAIPLYSIPGPSKIEDVRQEGVTIEDTSSDGTLTEVEIEKGLESGGFSGAKLVENANEMNSNNWYFAIVQYYVPTEGGSGKIQ